MLFGGNVLERAMSENEVEDHDDIVTKGPIWFVQTEDGSIPTTFYSRGENQELINIIKAAISAFQANFKGSSLKKEADPQSLHMAEYV